MGRNFLEISERTGLAEKGPIEKGPIERSHRAGPIVSRHFSPPLLLRTSTGIYQSVRVFLIITCVSFTEHWT